MCCSALVCYPVVAQDATAPVAVPLGKSPDPAPAPAYLSDPKFQEALEKAKEKRLPEDERLARWKHADKIAKNQCVECLRQIITLQMKGAQWKDAVNSAVQMDAIATERKDKYFAAMEHGQALMHGNGDRPKDKDLKEAQTAFDAALQLSPKSKPVLYSDGRVLAMLGRDDEAKAIFQRYLDAVGLADTYRTRVEHFIENPKLATVQMAPAFTLTTSEGEQISLDDMGGKVVFLDFWATWCGPCKESLPAIKKIAKDFAGQPLVVVSISVDRDDVAWKTFIEKNQMTWTQYRDANGALANAYGAQSIPRTFMIDMDGALQSVKVGWGQDSDPESDVRRLVKKAVEAEKKKAKESEKVGTN